MEVQTFSEIDSLTPYSSSQFVINCNKLRISYSVLYTKDKKYILKQNDNHKGEYSFESSNIEDIKERVRQDVYKNGGFYTSFLNDSQTFDQGFDFNDSDFAPGDQITYDEKGNLLRNGRKQTTLSLIVDETQNTIVLATKISGGFGADYFNAPGGKQVKGETIEQTAIREAKEEVNLDLLEQQLIGKLHFFPEGKSGMDVFIYLSTQFTGELSPSNEMVPEWVSLDNIPFERMWKEDGIWLTEYLSNKKFFEINFFSDSQWNYLGHEKVI